MVDITESLEKRKKELKMHIDRQGIVHVPIVPELKYVSGKSVEFQQSKSEGPCITGNWLTIQFYNAKFKIGVKEVCDIKDNFEKIELSVELYDDWAYWNNIDFEYKAYVNDKVRKYFFNILKYNGNKEVIPNGNTPYEISIEI